MGEPIQNPTTKPISALSVGSFAGLCAVFVPRLYAAVVTQSNDLNFFPLYFVILGSRLALVVGLVVMIFEWGAARPLKDIFMMALGIPALLAGAVTANQNADTLKTLTQQQAQLSKVLSQEAQIPILPQTPVSPIKGQRSLQLEHDHFPPQFMGSTHGLCPSKYELKCTA